MTPESISPARKGEEMPEWVREEIQSARNRVAPYLHEVPMMIQGKPQYFRRYDRSVAWLADELDRTREELAIQNERVIVQREEQGILTARLAIAEKERDEAIDRLAIAEGNISRERYAALVANASLPVPGGEVKP